jgi:hydrogenase large subunit
MNEWGNAMYVTPGIVIDGKLVTTTWSTSTSAFASCSGSSFYDDWEDQETFVKTIRSAIPSIRATRGTRPPSPARRSATSTTNTPGSCRPAGSTSGTATTWRSTPAADPLPGCGRPRWPDSSTSATSRPPGSSVKIYLPKTASKPEVEFEWKIPQWSNAIERDRARTYFQAYAAGCALHFVEQALKEVHAGRTKTWTDFEVPDEAIGCGFHEAVRGVLSHHVVIRDGKIANYHPYPPTPWNANPRDSVRHARPVRRRRPEDARSSRRTASTTSRASTSCGPCAASIRVSPVACTCTWVRARR